MKKYLFLITLFFASNCAFAQMYGGNFFNATPNPYHPSYRQQKSLPDGWYEATVYYTSHTGTQSTYKLNVKCEDERVVVIDFGNGGFVHAGRNYRGYQYKGGHLVVYHDSDGDPYAADGSVTVTYPDGGWQQFRINIQ